MFHRANREEHDRRRGWPPTPDERERVRYIIAGTREHLNELKARGLRHDHRDGAEWCPICGRPEQLPERPPLPAPPHLEDGPRPILELLAGALGRPPKHDHRFGWQQCPLCGPGGGA